MFADGKRRLCVRSTAQLLKQMNHREVRSQGSFRFFRAGLTNHQSPITSKNVDQQPPYAFISHIYSVGSTTSHSSSMTLDCSHPPTAHNQAAPANSELTTIAM